MAGRKPEKSVEEVPPRDTTFASPDWIEDHVISKGEKGAVLWRHLKGIWGDNLQRLEKDWNHFSKALEG